MTSPASFAPSAATAPAITTPAATGTSVPRSARRMAPVPAARRTSEIVLVAGTVIAVAAAFGPTWAVRVGLAVAITAAVVACVFAWRELFSARREHAAATLNASREHGRAMTEERKRNGVVVDSLNGRIRDAAVVIERQRVTIAELRVQISGLRGDKAYLRAELDHREGVISSLRDTVRAREAELRARAAAEAAAAEAAAAESNADRSEAEESNAGGVHPLPRRVLAAHASTWDELPAAEDLWTDGSHPTVVDLKMLDAAMVLPNYEVDRKVG